ncbi:MAG: hypothetical protein Q7V01_11435 [Vicinamibacterales bacterium]|nr:hypothetical protein [Vicinamibacterales bacterium]
MKLQRLTAATALLLACTVATSTAWAQSRGEGQRRNGAGTARTSESGGQARADQGARGGRDVAVNRSDARPQSGRAAVNEGRSRATENRGYSGGQTGGQTSGRSGNAVRPNTGNNRPGSAVGNRGYDSRSNSNRGYDNRGYSNRGYSGRDYGRYGSYNRDMWRGRVRFGLNVSIFAGNPFRFRFDYGWRPSFSYHYTMRPGLAYGGMSFLLQPDYAEVYIDGEFVGNARDFGGQPVPVSAGYHRIELYAPGFEPSAFDIHVLPGQVIPYRGSLYPEAAYR